MNLVASPNDEYYQPFTQSEVASSIPEVFERRTQGFGQRIAIQTQERSYTYASLKTAANRIAHALLEQLGDGSEPIAILLNDTSEAVAAILGILKAGKIYLPLDVSLALPRLRYLIEDSRARLLLTDTQTLTLARELIANTALPILNLDRLPNGALPGEFPTTNTPDRLAALLYTSGSTAQPKGVMHSHRTLLHLTMRYTNLHRVTHTRPYRAIENTDGDRRQHTRPRYSTQRRCSVALESETTRHTQPVGLAADPSNIDVLFRPDADSHHRQERH